MPAAIEAAAATPASIFKETAAIGPNTTAMPFAQPDAMHAEKASTKAAAKPWKGEAKPLYGWSGDDYALNGGFL